MTYFTKTDYVLTAGKLVQTDDINNLLTALETSFESFPDETNLKRDTVNFTASDTGAANAYAVAMNQPISSYIDGMQVVFRAANSNTSAACTINVDEQGAKDIKRSNGTDLEADDISAEKLVELRYDAENGYFVLLSAATYYSSDAIANDTSPQLGGDLDTNGYLIDTRDIAADGAKLDAVETRLNNAITLNKSTVDTEHTIPDGYNALSVGPLNIEDTVIINENSVWEIL